MSKPIICVNFDGVLHSYASGWQGANIVNDGPVPGAMEWLASLTHHFTVCIYSSRSRQAGGVAAMQQAIYRWVQEETDMTPGWLSQLQYPKEKPAAFLTIDDRAICFKGEFEPLQPEILLRFTPWNKGEVVQKGTEVEQGYQAYKDGLDLEDCPFDKDTEAEYWWKTAWSQAEANDEPRAVKQAKESDEGNGAEPADYNTEGAQAFDAGQALSDCPYEDGSDAAVEWEGGWMEAEEASRTDPA